MSQSRAMKHRSKVAAGVLATISMLLVPSVAFAQPGGGGGAGGQGGGGASPPPPEQAPAKIKVKVKGLKGGKAKVGERVEAIVTVGPFVAGQRVEIRLQNGGDT